MGATRHRLRSILTGEVLAALLAASPALALVGPAQDDNSFASHLVMVLNRGVDRAGFCTGVVVAPRAVLTAAHCVTSTDNMRIYYRGPGGEPVLQEIAASAVHPLFRADAPAKRAVSIDLALIETRAPLDKRFSPATLDDKGAATVGAALTIFGYGVAREGDGKTAGALRAARLAVRAPLSPILLWAEDPAHSGAGRLRYEPDLRPKAESGRAGRGPRAGRRATRRLSCRRPRERRRSRKSSKPRRPSRHLCRRASPARSACPKERASRSGRDRSTRPSWPARRRETTDGRRSPRSPAAPARRRGRGSKCAYCRSKSRNGLRSARRAARRPRRCKIQRDRRRD